MDLTAQPKPVRKIDLTANRSTNPPVSDLQIAEARTNRYEFALGEDAPPREELSRIVSTGHEKDLRQAVASKEALKRITFAQGMVSEALGNVTGNDVGDPEYILALTQTDAVDPSVVLENKFATNSINTLQALNDDPAQAAEEVQNPSGAETLYKMAEDITAKKQVAIKLAEDWGQNTKQMGWGPYLGYQAMDMVGVFQWANFASHDRKANWERTGTAIFTKVQQLYSLPDASEFKKEAEKELNRLAQLNPLNAQQFAEALVQYGHSDKDWANFWNVVNVGTGVTGGAVLKGATGLVKTTARLRKISRAVTQANTTIPDVLANAGHISESAEAASSEIIARTVAPKNAPDAVVDNYKNLVQQTPSQFNPKFFLGPEGSMSPQLAERLTMGTAANIAKFATAAKIIRPATLTPEALQKAQELTLQEYKKSFAKLSDNIMRVEHVSPEDTGTGTAKMIIQWGKDEGRSTFQTESGAKHTAVMRYKLKDFKTKQISEDSWIIETSVDVSENYDDVFQILKTTNNSGPASTWTYLRSFLGAKEQVSDFHAQQRAATVHGTTQMGQVVASVWRPALEKLSKKELADLDVIMAVNRDSYRVPGDPETRGMFYENYSELNQAYLQIHKRPVRDNEAEAYIAARQMSDFDWKIRSENAARNKIRVGAQNHTFKVISKNDKPESVTLEAIKIDKLPINSKDDANVMIYGEGDDVVTVARLSDIVNDPRVKDASGKSLINNLFEKGYTALQVYDPSRRTLNDVLNYKEPIHYVVVKGTRPSAIRLADQVPYRPGFHVEYNQPWYIKQGKFGFNKGRRAFLGDITLLGIRTEKEGRQFLQVLTEAQRLYKAKDKSLESYLTSKTPWSLKEFEKIMENFDKDTPFVLARDGKTSADGSSLTHNGQTYSEVYQQFDNLVNSPHNPALMHNFEFMGEKDPMLNKLVVEGTQRDPIYKLEDADLLSPLATQTRAMGRLIRSVGYEDYQIGSVMNFLAKFENALKFNGNPVSPEVLRRNPLFYFKNTTIDHANPMVKEQARQIKQRILDLVGQPSQYAIGLEDFVQRLSEDGRIPFAEKTMPFLKDPLRHARAAVSHMKLGLFNPVQLFLQQATHANIALISPVHGLSQVPATILMRFADKSESPAIWDYYASLVEKAYGTNKGKYGWNAAKFKESLEGYKRSGFGIIGGEYAWRNDISDPKLFRGKVAKFLDKGYIFFNHAEQNVRMAAWNTAYSEYLANTGKVAGSLKDADFRKVLVRAQDLSGNMSRDANAFWQKGLLGSTTQYYAYTARIVELLLGKRLSRAERMRLGGGLSLLYGFPILAGATYLAETGDWEGAIAAVNPFDEDLRTYALENGQNIDDTAWGAINNGLASSALYLLTGEHFDVASRYSPLNLDVTGSIKRNIELHDPTMAILVSALGASGSIIRDVLQSSYPLAKDFYQMVGEGETSQLVAEDIFNMLRELSSVNAGYKVYTAWNGYDYMSKKGTLVSENDDENFNSKLIEALSGLQSYEETDTFRKINSLKLDARGQEEVKKELRKYGSYYVQAMERQDRTAMDQFMRRIEALMLTVHDTKERTRLWGEIFSHQELKSSVSKAFTKKGSQEQQIKRQLQLQESNQ